MESKLMQKKLTIERAKRMQSYNMRTEEWLYDNPMFLYTLIRPPKPFLSRCGTFFISKRWKFIRQRDLLFKLCFTWWVKVVPFDEYVWFQKTENENDILMLFIHENMNFLCYVTCCNLICMNTVFSPFMCIIYLCSFFFLRNYVKIIILIIIISKFWLCIIDDVWTWGLSKYGLTD